MAKQPPSPSQRLRIPRTKVIGKRKLFSPHLSPFHHSQSSAQKTFNFHLSTFNSQLSTPPTLSRCSGTSKALPCSASSDLANASIAAGQSQRDFVPQSALRLRCLHCGNASDASISTVLRPLHCLHIVLNPTAAQPKLRGSTSSLPLQPA